MIFPFLHHSVLLCSILFLSPTLSPHVDPLIQHLCLHFPFFLPQLLFNSSRPTQHIHHIAHRHCASSHTEGISISLLWFRVCRDLLLMSQVMLRFHLSRWPNRQIGTPHLSYVIIYSHLIWFDLIWCCILYLYVWLRSGEMHTVYSFHTISSPLSLPRTYSTTSTINTFDVKSPSFVKDYHFRLSENITGYWRRCK